MKTISSRVRITLSWLALTGLCQFSSPGAPTNLFVTQFEAAQGYNINLDLAGQAGWQKFGAGGNGIVTNFFPGQGQQAYVGYGAPGGTNDQLAVWQPLNFNPLATGLPIVKFSVQMQVNPSTAGEQDYFQWVVYNSAVHELFTLDFDTYSGSASGILTTNVSYRLDGTNNYVRTGVHFAPGTIYSLQVTMNFASNRWSATLGSTLLVTNQPITTTGAALTLGDIDARWLLYDTNAPGNNFLVFDNYQITAEALTNAPAPVAQIQLLGRTLTGTTLLRVLSAEGSRWSVDASTNLVNWTALKTNPISGGSFDYIDSTASAWPRRYYRARLVP